VASLSQGRTAAAQCGLFTYKSVPVIFEPPCISIHSFIFSDLLFLTCTVFFYIQYSLLFTWFVSIFCTLFLFFYQYFSMSGAMSPPLMVNIPGFWRQPDILLSLRSTSFLNIMCVWPHFIIIM